MYALVVQYGKSDANVASVLRVMARLYLMRLGDPVNSEGDDSAYCVRLAYVSLSLELFPLSCFGVCVVAR